MKKIKYIIIIGGILIVSIISIMSLFNQNDSNNHNRTFQNEGFLANKGEISLLIVSSEIEGKTFKDKLREKGLNVQNLRPITVYDSLDQAKKDFPQLKINQEPTFILFDSKKPIFSTNDEQKLIVFLKNYK